MWRRKWVKVVVNGKVDVDVGWEEQEELGEGEGS